MSSTFQKSIVKYFKKTGVYILLSLLLLTISSGVCTTSNLTQGLPVSHPSPTPSFTPTQTLNPPMAAPSLGLTKSQIASLLSLEKVDDYPLYIMDYSAPYELTQASSFNKFDSLFMNFNPDTLLLRTWSCSLFAALNDPDNLLFGRNFDWEFSPALLLFTNPPNGYASISMVDIAYLGFNQHQIDSLDQLPLEERLHLLEAPYWPFDGLNERGVAIGMAAVPPSDMQNDPGKKTIDPLQVMREILDNAADVNQAVSILSSYNIDYKSGPALHYLIADSIGQAILVEFYQNQMQLIPNDSPWHQATNFLLSSVKDPQGQCWRYDRISNELDGSKGMLSPKKALELLSSVSQPNTQWSIVYHLDEGAIDVVMGRKFGNIHRFKILP